MPHDSKGNILKVGDRVLIPAIVTAISAEENYCNLTVELEHEMPTGGGKTQKSSIGSINAAQVEKAMGLKSGDKLPSRNTGS